MVQEDQIGPIALVFETLHLHMVQQARDGDQDQRGQVPDHQMAAAHPLLFCFLVCHRVLFSARGGSAGREKCGYL